MADNDGLSRTGADLEDAKGQLEEVVEITEQASIKIMDLADLIQADVDTLQKQMSDLNNLGFLIEKDGQEESLEKPEISESGANGELFLEKFKELKNIVNTISLDTGASPIAPQIPTTPPAPVKEVTPALSKIIFSLDVVFQTLYEFCTNETVKKHIKEMRDDIANSDFDEGAIEGDLSDLAHNIGEDDGLYNFPLKSLLKIIYTHTKSEKNKNNLKKMNQTIGSIFLDENLPLEGQVAPPEEAVEEVQVEEAAPDPEPITEGAEEGSSPHEDRLKAIVNELDALVTAGNLPGSAGGGAAASGGNGEGSYTSIPTKDRDVIVSTLAASDKLIQNTTEHLTHIMEALSFQDLSGQRIKKIVALIGEIQVQLLSLLVSVDTKIKAHHEAPTKPRPKEETEKVAQAEVDKMLEKLNAEPSELKGPGAENRLDQGAVNDLLSQLGF
jgi:chemotaxis regulatin CheY-phosphate phosphatase CheZ